MDPVLTEVWDLGVEGQLEQWPVVGESGNGSTGSTAPQDQVTGVSPSSSEVEATFGELVDWSLDVL